MAKRTLLLAVGWVGIDVSKSWFDVAIWGDQAFGEMTLKRFKRTEKGAEAFVAWLSSLPRKAAGLVMEWTGSYSRELAGWLYRLREGWTISLINPCLVKYFGKSLNLRNKTDEVDARLLAVYGHERKPSPWIPPTPEEDQLKSMYRTRAKLVQIQTMLGNRDEACSMAAPESQKAHHQVLETIRDQIQALERGVNELTAGASALKRDRMLLQSIPGVGPITSMGVLAELGDLRRFRRGRQLTAFAGVSPKRFESGKYKGKSHMCKVGGTNIRPTLYMAAVSLTNRSGPLGEFYRRLVGRGIPEKAAIGALMRKMRLLMRAVLIQNKPYERVTQKPEAPARGPRRPARPEGRRKDPGVGRGASRTRGRLQDGQAIARQERGESVTLKSLGTRRPRKSPLSP